MSKTVEKFDYEMDIHGARVVALTTDLTAGCASEMEIETSIQMLKDDLDAVAELMKKAVQEQRGKSLLGIASHKKAPRPKPGRQFRES